MTGVPGYRQKLPAFVEMLKGMADEEGIVPSLDLLAVAEQLGSTEAGVRAMFGRLRDTGRAEVVDKGKHGMSATYRLIDARTGVHRKPLNRVVGRQPPRPAAPAPAEPPFSGTAIARGLRDRYGIEVETVSHFSGSISLPRVKALAGAMP